MLLPRAQLQPDHVTREVLAAALEQGRNARQAGGDKDELLGGAGDERRCGLQCLNSADDHQTPLPA